MGVKLVFEKMDLFLKITLSLFIVSFIASIIIIFLNVPEIIVYVVSLSTILLFLLFFLVYAYCDINDDDDGYYA
jgi:hypothetical protein